MRGPYGADRAPLLHVPSGLASGDVPLDYGHRPFFAADPDEFKSGAPRRAAAARMSRLEALVHASAILIRAAKTSARLHNAR